MTPLKTLVKSMLARRGLEIRQTAGQRFVFDAGAGVVFDVGAHIGERTADFLQAYPGATIYAFEPYTEFYNGVKARFAGRANVKPFNFAFGAETGEAELILNDLNLSMVSTLSQTESWDEAQPLETMTIAVRTIDAFLAEQGIERIAYLKIDTEGNDLNVLIGAKATLAAGKIDVIEVEYPFKKLFKNGVRYLELSGLLENAGYRLVDLQDIKRDRFGILRYANAIFLREALWQAEYNK